MASSRNSAGKVSSNYAEYQKAYLSPALVDYRTLKLGGIAVLVAFFIGFAAQGFIRLINIVTNIAFFWRFSLDFTSPSNNSRGLWVVVIPVIGAIIVGLMARYGSKAIRGHGIPEAMEQVLLNESRIPPKVAILKPLSAAIAIGTGGPFGAEGPIIATGGAIGSFFGQLLKITADERKTLLAAGAAAGMAATFGTPVSAVLLAIELLLFEFKARSIIPVALAAVTATGVRFALVGSQPFASMQVLTQPGGQAIAVYIALGGLFGLISVGITKLLYAIEDGFEKLPIHWMWWPAIGAIAIGIVGYFDPKTLGVGYENIDHILSGNLTLGLLISLGIFKLISWSISLGSGTSGGTLAPLFTIGGALGGVFGIVISKFFPFLGIDPRIAGLIGMAAIFAGASRAFLASVIFTFEITRRPISLLPLLGGCAAAYFISCFLTRNSLMTEKIIRSGVRVPSEYSVDFLDHINVRDIASRRLVVVKAHDTVGEVRRWVTSGANGTTHQGFPVVDAKDCLVGVVTLRDILAPSVFESQRIEEIIIHPPIVIYEDCSARQAIDQMARHNIGRLPVISKEDNGKIIGILTRSDLLAAHSRNLDEHSKATRTIRIKTFSLSLIYKNLRGKKKSSK